MSDDRPDSDDDNSVWDDLEETGTDEHSTESTDQPTVDPTETDGIETDQTKDANTPQTDELFEALDEDRSAAAASEADEIFDEMDVSQVDGEALWDQLAEYESEAKGLWDAVETPTVDSGETATTPKIEETPDHDGGLESQRESDDTVGDETVSDDTVSDDTVTVDKRQYCQQCPYFSDPPEVSCSHDGTTIVEVLTDGQFRLRGCPVVTDSGPDRTILNDGH